MIPLARKLWYAVRYDELAVRRWSRGLVLTLSASAASFAPDITATPEQARIVRIVGVVAALIAGMITAGEKNPE